MLEEQSKDEQLSRLYKPLSPLKKTSIEVNLSSPFYYPEELSKDLFFLLRTPLPDGTTVPLKKLPLKQEQSKYWFDKINIVGLLIAVSTLFLLGILLQETDFLQIIWDFILGVI